MYELDNILAKYSTENKLPCALGAVVTKDKGLVYVGGSGLKDIDDKESKIDFNNTSLAFFSCTKAIATTALLHLLDSGLIDSIDDPVEKYVDEVKDIQILIGFDDNNKPILKDTINKMTIRHLLTHSAGFSYSFFSHPYKSLYENNNTANILKSSWDQFKTPLLFEPGTKWHYGVNIDWIGKIVYEVSNLSLGDYCKKFIFQPIGANSLTFEKSKEQLNNSIEIHQRYPDGKISALKGLLVDEPEFHPGGHGLYGKISDYMKFLEIFLHDGKSPNTGIQILKPETIHNYSFKNLLPNNVYVESTLEHSQPLLSNKIELFDMFPKEKQGWTASFHKIDVPLSTGRSSGSYSWAGLPNLYYWIDVEKGITGMFATQIFPFSDEIALEGFNEFETAVYNNYTRLGSNL
ncbi:hypothetical protein C6P42_003484 [Pichia californica]|nr:hypothetical protein C6P42_003484 [[Candida] californica]